MIFIIKINFQFIINTDLNSQNITKKIYQNIIININHNNKFMKNIISPNNNRIIIKIKNSIEIIEILDEILIKYALILFFF